MGTIIICNYLVLPINAGVIIIIQGPRNPGRVGVKGHYLADPKDKRSNIIKDFNEVVRFIGKDECKKAFSLYESRELKKHNYLMMSYEKFQSPLIDALHKTWESIDQAAKVHSIKFIDEATTITNIASILRDLRNVEIINPRGELVHKTLREIYISDLLGGEEFWDSLFELEVASTYVRLGFRTRIVEEGEEGGPDLQVIAGDKQFWIECKSKRNKTPEEMRIEKLLKQITDDINREVDVGDDSFWVKIYLESPLKEDHIESICNCAINAVNTGSLTSTIAIDHNVIRVELAGYYEGKKRMSRWIYEKKPFEFIGISSTFKEIEGMHAVQHMYDWDGKNRYVVYHCSIIEIISPPLEIDYSKWILNSVKKSRSNLSGFFPSLVWINVPPRIPFELKKRMSLQHPGFSQESDLADGVKSNLGSSGAIVGIVLSAPIVHHKGDLMMLDRINSTIYKIENYDDIPELERLIGFAKNG